MRAARGSTGFMIALAWPETYCKQPGSWYDSITGLLGFTRNNYYRAGHAAVVLVDTERSKCHYFDFGRYHAPLHHGRVRSAVTDHDLEMKTVPRFNDDKSVLSNYDEILDELQANPACHGEGALHASYAPADFCSAFNRAVGLQKISPIPYGPFRRGGSNCSRFVFSVLAAGKPAFMNNLLLRFAIPLTPTPLSNVRAFDDIRVVPAIRPASHGYPVVKPTQGFLMSTLPAPPRHDSIPQHAHWLGGEGSGSWFTVEKSDPEVIVTRYSPEGEVECKGRYAGINGFRLNGQKDIRVTYQSNCREINLVVEGRETMYKRV